VRVALSTARLLLAASAVLLLLPSGSSAAEPPNSKDPCSSGGRNTCGTLGVGFYDEGRYGVRWFGDFRGAVAGQVPMFCLDSRFWYASPAYRYRQARAGVLRNRDGEVVSSERQQKIAYAIWTYGQSKKPNQQAAVAVYVHSLVGDARAGEADPAAVNSRVVALYKKIAADASRFHGPYTIETRLSEQPTVGKTVRATVRVLSAAGNALPSVPLRLAAGATLTVPAEVRTNRNGVAVVPLTPTGAGQSRLRVDAAPVASTLPKIFRATTRAAAANAQRLAAPASQRISAATSVTVRATPTLATASSTRVARGGSRIFDRIRVTGLGTTAATIEAELFGPFASRAAIRCAGRPSWTGSVIANGDGAIRLQAPRLARPGFYTHRVRVRGSRYVDEFTTECARPTQTALIAPLIFTGGTDTAGYVAAPTTRGSRPTRVRLASLEIDAAVLGVGIDLNRGALGAPKSIRHAGWWKDGQAPGARSGTILIAGHVDSARGGAGAFFSLHKAQIGAKVQLQAASGRTFTYRVTSVRSYRKNALPTSIYSSQGRPRLVLVTCGGPFNQATGHYRDNIVVTAVVD
jgi:hypothetical protein